MSNQIIKQPNGLYAIFSSVVDGFTYWNMTRQDIIDLWVEEQRQHLTESVNKFCDALDASKNVYHQFQWSWDEALSEHERRHGIDEELRTLTQVDSTKEKQ